jgi:uncharacterized membrane protein YqiK
LSSIIAEREAAEKRITDQNVVEIDVFRRRRQAEIARQAAELEAESIRTLADAEKYKLLAEAQGKLAAIQAENTLSDANRTADLIKVIFPIIAPQLPEILKSLSPQPGVLGDARIYAFPGLNGNGTNSGNDINKILLSTSGLSLINTLLDEGKLGNIIAQIKGLLQSNSSENNTSLTSNLNYQPNVNSEIINPENTSSTIDEIDPYMSQSEDVDFYPWADEKINN